MPLFFICSLSLIFNFSAILILLALLFIRFRLNLVALILGRLLDELRFVLITEFVRVVLGLYAPRIVLVQKNLFLLLLNRDSPDSP